MQTLPLWQFYSPRWRVCNLILHFYFQPHDTYKPPTPGGFSLNSVTSFNVDEVANRNEERLRRLELIQRGGGQGGRGSLHGDPDQVLQRFMDERRYPYHAAILFLWTLIYDDVNKHWSVFFNKAKLIVVLICIFEFFSFHTVVLQTLPADFQKPHLKQKHLLSLFKL